MGHCSQIVDSEVTAKWKEVKGKPGKNNELILKTNVDLKEEPGNNHPWIIFPFNWLVIIWRVGKGGGGKGFRLKLDVQGQGGGIILDVDAQEGGGSWKSDNFHGCHMCIIPNRYLYANVIFSIIS